MATEIERKFLVVGEQWRTQWTREVVMRQGYIIGGKKASVRVRMADDKAFLNIKSATLTITRKEYEFEMPVQDADEILSNLCDGPLIEKKRFYVPHNGHVWEIDEFDGDNKGLIVAEIELRHAQASFDKPGWLGNEVSDDPRYYNVCLVQHPYKDW